LLYGDLTVNQLWERSVFIRGGSLKSPYEDKKKPFTEKFRGLMLKGNEMKKKTKNLDLQIQDLSERLWGITNSGGGQRGGPGRN